jgi:hypothetical protein
MIMLSFINFVYRDYCRAMMIAMRKYHMSAHRVQKRIALSCFTHAPASSAGGTVFPRPFAALRLTSSNLVGWANRRA